MDITNVEKPYQATEKPNVGSVGPYLSENSLIHLESLVGQLSEITDGNPSIPLETCIMLNPCKLDTLLMNRPYVWIPNSVSVEPKVTSMKRILHVAVGNSKKCKTEKTRTDSNATCTMFDEDDFDNISISMHQETLDVMEGGMYLTNSVSVVEMQM